MMNLYMILFVTCNLGNIVDIIYKDVVLILGLRIQEYRKSNYLIYKIMVVLYVDNPQEWVKW